MAFAWRRSALLFLASALLACTPFDSGSTPPSPSDAGPAVDSGPTDQRRFCERAAAAGFVFCDDFEETPRATTAGWEGQKITTGEMSIGAPPVAVAGSQRSLHVTLSSDGVSHDAQLGREIKVPVRFQKIEVSYRALVHLSNMQFARLGTIFAVAENFAEVRGVTLFASGPELLLDGDLQAAAPTLSTKFDRWHSCTTTLTHEGGGAEDDYRAITRIDALEVSNEVVPIDPDARIDLLFGVLQTSNDDASIDVWLDDLLLRTE
jgi:hypothetical protein